MSNDKSRIKDKKLILEAKKAMKLAYAPYSNFKVGVALLSSSGKVFTGANLENSSFGLTVCAERVALYKALSSGGKEFTKIAVIASAEKPITPCGLCRQALFEFSPDLKVICSNLKGKVRKFTLKQLLPHPFSYDKKRKGK
ncbi:MAG: cytidine deaminase [candidate division Zixibacteria bacterium]|nr:cytidine deaminase [candidate division Zixibacteria bacterium]